MVCPHCGATNSEQARFCVECGQPLPRACPNCGAINPPGARFCNQCGFALAGAPTRPATSPAAPPALTPEQRATALGEVTPVAPSALAGDLPSQPAAGVQEEETEQRRVVTVLFADLANSTTLAEALDAEEMRAILTEFFATMRRQIQRHGGSVEKYIGDAIMAVFGLPVAHEDDPVRAIRAALDMQASLHALNASLASDDSGISGLAGLNGLNGLAAQDGARPELRLRIGINTGEVAAATGIRAGQDFLVTGDPVNVAARLQQLAEPGAILVGPRTYRSARGLAEFRQAPPAPLRGKVRPVAIWEVFGLLGDERQAPSARPRGYDGAPTPLVGRESEMTLLDAVALRTMRERSPHLITIIGAPGVGKTRLAREFAARVCAPGSEAPTGARRATSRRAPTEPTQLAEPTEPLFLEGRCPPYGEDVTYWPLTEMLRFYAGVTALDTPAAARARLLSAVSATLAAAGRSENPEIIAAYLGHTIGIESAERRRRLLPSDATQLQEGALRAWRLFFESLAATRGLVAMIDDAHWADDALLDLLAFVAAGVSGVALLFILTARPDLIERRPTWGGGRRNYVTLGLEPLSPDDAARLLDELLPGPSVPASLRQGILDKADGNPFFVEEIVRMLVDRGALVQDGGPGWRVAPEWEQSEEVRDPIIPDTVQGVLVARLDLLPPTERDVLQHASVIGRYFWPSALMQVERRFQFDDVTEALQALSEKDLIHPSERASVNVASPGETAYTFNHQLTREVVYGTIPRTRRAHEHLRIAEWLEARSLERPGQYTELLAQHYYRYYTLANLSRSRDQARRSAVRARVASALEQAGGQSVARHALTKADGYYTDALELFGEEIEANDAPLAVTLRVARGAERWLALRADDAWSDYREALRIWAATSDMISPATDPSDALGVATPVASRSQPGAADSGSMRAPSSPDAPAMLPLDWRQQGMRLYRTLVQLPTRSEGWFRRPPPHEELAEYLDEALRLADELGQRDTLDYAELLTAKSFFWWSWAERRSERDLLDAHRSAREAVRITEALGDGRAASEALDALGNIQAIMTDLTGYLESQKRRLRWVTEIDEAQEIVDINTEVSQAYQMVGEYAEAERYAQTALALAHEVDADALCVKALWGVTLARFEWDHWTEAIQTGAELQARAPHTVLRFSNHHLWALLALATIAARTGDADATERLARIVGETTPTPTPPAQYVEVARARLASARGEQREAQQLLLSALDMRSGRSSMAALLAELAELAARGADLDLYDRFGAEAMELGWRSGARKALAQALRARAIVAVSASRWDDALADGQNALTRYQALGCDWEEARSRYVLAGLYRRRAEQGDDDRAREELTQALRLFDGLRAVRDIARARSALSGGEVRLP